MGGTLDRVCVPMGVTTLTGALGWSSWSMRAGHYFNLITPEKSCFQIREHSEVLRVRTAT